MIIIQFNCLRRKMTVSFFQTAHLVSIKSIVFLMDFISSLVTSLSVSLQPFGALRYSVSCWANTFRTLWQFFLPYSCDRMFMSLKHRANDCGLPLRSLCPRLGSLRTHSCRRQGRSCVHANELTCDGYHCTSDIAYHFDNAFSQPY